MALKIYNVFFAALCGFLLAIGAFMLLVVIPDAARAAAPVTPPSDVTASTCENLAESLVAGIRSSASEGALKVSFLSSPDTRLGRCYTLVYITSAKRTGLNIIDVTSGANYGMFSADLTSGAITCRIASSKADGFAHIADLVADGQKCTEGQFTRYWASLISAPVAGGHQPAPLARAYETTADCTRRGAVAVGAFEALNFAAFSDPRYVSRFNTIARTCYVVVSMHNTGNDARELPTTIIAVLNAGTKRILAAKTVTPLTSYCDLASPSIDAGAANLDDLAAHDAGDCNDRQFANVAYITVGPDALPLFAGDQPQR